MAFNGYTSSSNDDHLYHKHATGFEDGEVQNILDIRSYNVYLV